MGVPQRGEAAPFQSWSFVWRTNEVALLILIRVSLCGALRPIPPVYAPLTAARLE